MTKYLVPLIFLLLLSQFNGWGDNPKADNDDALLDNFIYSPNLPSKNKIDSILIVAKKVFKNGSNVAKIKSLLVIGRANIISGEYMLARQSLESGLLLLSKIEQQKLHGDYYLEVGKLYNLSRQYARSLNYYNLALSMYEKFGSKDDMAMAKLGIVEIHRKLEQFDEADKLLKEISRQIESSSSSYVRAEYYNRLAAVYNEKNDDNEMTTFLDSSMYYSTLSLAVAEQSQNKHLMAISLNELGFSYEIKNKIDSAYFYYSRAEKIWDELKYFRYSSQVKNNLARIFLKEKDYQNSMKKIMELLPVAEVNDWKDNMVYSYFLLAENYEKRHDYKSSLNFFKKYTELKFITLEEEKSTDISEAKEKFQSHEREYHLAQIEYEKRISESKKNYLIIMSLTILVAIAFVIIINQRRRKRFMIN